jgi:hypothetical protein
VIALSRASRVRALAVRKAVFTVDQRGSIRRQVRRVGRQVQQTSAASGQGLLDPHGFMRSEIVHHDTIARPQWRTQHLLHRSTKGIGVGRPVDGQDRVHAVDAQRSQPGDIRAVVLGYAPDDPLPCGSTAIAARHREVHARFIHALQALAVERCEPLLVDRSRLLDTRGLAFRRVERLFWRCM